MRPTIRFNTLCLTFQEFFFFFLLIDLHRVVESIVINSCKYEIPSSGSGLESVLEKVESQKLQ